MAVDGVSMFLFSLLHVKVYRVLYSASMIVERAVRLPFFSSILS